MHVYVLYMYAITPTLLYFWFVLWRCICSCKQIVNLSLGNNYISNANPYNCCNIIELVIDHLVTCLCLCICVVHGTFCGYKIKTL